MNDRSSIRREHLDRWIIPINHRWFIVWGPNRFKWIKRRLATCWQRGNAKIIKLTEALVRKSRGLLRCWSTCARIQMIFLLILCDFWDLWCSFKMQLILLARSPCCRTWRTYCRVFIKSCSNIRNLCSCLGNLGNWGGRHPPETNATCFFI
jgi:hypothetical protein